MFRTGVFVVLFCFLLFLFCESDGFTNSCSMKFVKLVNTLDQYIVKCHIRFSSVEVNIKDAYTYLEITQLERCAVLTNVQSVVRLIGVSCGTSMHVPLGLRLRISCASHII